MKVLHTSDWHVGRTIRGRSREDEHVAVLSEIAAIVREEGVDLVLVAGDIFDSAAPAATAEEIVYRALLEMTAAGARVALVAGNHDNYRRLGAVKPFLRLANVYASSSFARPSDGGCVDIEVASGEVARVAMFPWLSKRRVVDANDLMTGSQAQHQASYADTCIEAMEMLSAGFGKDTVNLLVAHLTTDNAVLGGGERDAETKGPGTIFDYWVRPQMFPKTAQYVALGHIHRMQKVGAPCPAWYSGSPLQLDFGEHSEGQGVLVFEARPGLPVADVRKIALTAGRKLRTIEGDLAGLRALKAEKGELDGAYLRVIVQEPARFGLADDVRGLFPNTVEIVAARPAIAAGQMPTRQGLTPRELLSAYLEEVGQSDARVLDLFDELS